MLAAPTEREQPRQVRAAASHDVRDPLDLPDQAVHVVARDAAAPQDVAQDLLRLLAALEDHAHLHAPLSAAHGHHRAVLQAEVRESGGRRLRFPLADGPSQEAGPHLGVVLDAPCDGHAVVLPREVHQVVDVRVDAPAVLQPRHQVGRLWGRGCDVRRGAPVDQLARRWGRRLDQGDVPGYRGGAAGPGQLVLQEVVPAFDAALRLAPDPADQFGGVRRAVVGRDAGAEPVIHQRSPLVVDGVTVHLRLAAAVGQRDVGERRGEVVDGTFLLGTDVLAHEVGAGVLEPCPSAVVVVVEVQCRHHPRHAGAPVHAVHPVVA